MMVSVDKSVFDDRGKMSTIVTLEENKLTYCVRFVELPLYIKNSFMYRRNEQPYVDACGREFQLDIFPPKLKDGVFYKEEYIQLCRYVLGIRIRRLVLVQEVSSFSAEIKALKDLLNQCREKESGLHDRIMNLETEIEALKPYDDSMPNERFNALLFTPQGWHMLCLFLNKELRRLANKGNENNENIESQTTKTIQDVTALQSGKVWKASRAADEVEEDDEHVDAEYLRSKQKLLDQIMLEEEEQARQLEAAALTTDKIRTSWHYMQVWRLVRCVEARCRLGEEKYPHKKQGAADDAGTSHRKKGRSERRSSDVDSDIDDIGNEIDNSSALKAVSALEVSQKTPASDKIIHHQHSADSLHSFHVSLVHEFDDAHLIVPWNSVCSYLKTENEGVITAALALRDLLVSEPDLYSLIDKTTQVNLAFGLREAAGDEDTSEFIASALSGICDALSRAIESLLLIAVRDSPQWLILMEELRRERIKRQGGKLLVKEKVELEIDAAGKRRQTPLLNVFIDTDVLHNTLQRLHYQVVGPAVESKLKSIQKRRNDIRGELACLAQFGFELVSPFIQRNARRVRTQRNYGKALRLLSYSSIHAASTIIQACIRGALRRWWYKRLVQSAGEALQHAAAISIQRIARGHAAYAKYMLYLRKKKADSEWFAITKYQALIRGFLERHRHRARLRNNMEEREREIRQWGCVKIQKIARGYIARKVLVPSLRLRKTLSPEMLRMVEAYLQKGDLWKFLKELDSEMHRLQQQVHDTTKREDDLATTFIDKVVARRQGQFDHAWTSFAANVETHANSNVRSKAAGVNRTMSSATQLLEQQDGRLTAMGTASTSSIRGDSTSSPLKGSLSKSDNTQGIPVRNELSSTSAEGSGLEFGSSSFYTQTSVTFQEDPIHRQQAEQALLSPLVKFASRVNSSSTLSPDKRAETNLGSVSSASRGGNATTVSGYSAGIRGMKGNKKGVPPGALLRRAISTTVQTGVDQELHRLKNSTARTTKLAEDIRDVYGQDVGKYKVMSNGNSADSKALGATVNNGGSLNTPDTRGRSRGRGGERKTGRMSAATSDWVSAAADVPQPITTGSISRPSATRSRSRSASPNKRASLSPVRNSVVQGDSTSLNNSSRGNGGAGKPSLRVQDMGRSLLVDIPRGVEDTLERVVKAAAIRCYVPNFFTGRQPSEAFSIYLAMPPGLAKMRYEQEAWSWANSTIHYLYTKGLKYVRDALPVSKLVMFLKSAHSPPALIDCVVEIIEALTEMGSHVALGFTHQPTVKQGTDIAQGKLTVQQELELYREDKARIQAVAVEDSLPVPDLVPEANYKVASKMLISMIESGAWMNLNAPMDDLLMHAAYLCVPHVPYARPSSPHSRLGSPLRSPSPACATDSPDSRTSTKSGRRSPSQSKEKSSGKSSGKSSPSSSPPRSTSKSKRSPVHKTVSSDMAVTTAPVNTNMGQEEFKQHILEMETLPPEAKKDAIRRRFRAALLVSTPYTLKLKSDGVISVKDLTSITLSHLEMPKALQDQVEALLSVVVTMAANAKIVPVARDLLAKGKDLFTVPMMYDPKFQRSPFDPYGRPARLGKLLPTKKARRQPILSGTNDKPTETTNVSAINGVTDDATKQEADYIPIPGGLWEIAEDEAAEEDRDIKHMYQFYEGHNLRAQAHKPVVDASTEHSIPGTGSVVGSNSLTSTSVADLSPSVNSAAVPDAAKTVRQKETDWNKRDYAAIVAKKKHDAKLAGVAPVNPKKLQPLVHLGMRGPNGRLLVNLVPISAMEAADGVSADISNRVGLHGPEFKRTDGPTEEQGHIDRLLTANSVDAGRQNDAAKVNTSKIPGSKSHSRRSHPKLTMPLTAAEEAATERLHAYNKDILLRMQDDFVRPYKCSYPHCGMTFSRLYTLRIHEKSHESFPEYHAYKKNIQVGLDNDQSSLAAELAEEALARVSLSQPVNNELSVLSRVSTARTALSASRSAGGLESGGSFASIVENSLRSWQHGWAADASRAGSAATLPNDGDVRELLSRQRSADEANRRVRQGTADTDRARIGTRQGSRRNKRESTAPLGSASESRLPPISLMSQELPGSSPERPQKVSFAEISVGNAVTTSNILDGSSDNNARTSGKSASGKSSISKQQVKGLDPSWGAANAIFTENLNDINPFDETDFGEQCFLFN